MAIPSDSRTELLPLLSQVCVVRCYSSEEIPLLHPQNPWAWFSLLCFMYLTKRLNAAIQKVLSLYGSCWGFLCANAEMEMRSDLQNLWREVGSPVSGRSSIIMTSIIPLLVFIGSLELLLDFPEAAVCLLSLVGIVL